MSTYFTYRISWSGLRWISVCTCSLLRWEAGHSSALNHHQMRPSSCLCPLTAPAVTVTIQQCEFEMGSCSHCSLLKVKADPSGETSRSQNSITHKTLTSFLSHTSMLYLWKKSILLRRILSLSALITCNKDRVCKIGFKTCEVLELQHLAKSGFVVR